MILISHRGNISGREPEKENTIEYILIALSRGYQVEVDIWFVDEKFYLGHAKPQYKIKASFLTIQNLWFHCKNLEALSELQRINEQASYKINYFWHQKDDVTLTSKGFIWAYPGKQPVKNSIAVMPEIHNDNIKSCIGICSDYIENYRNK